MKLFFIRPTSQEIESQVISAQEVSLKKQEIEDEYSTQLEIRKIEDKNKIEAKKLELEAMKSPLSIEVSPAPGTQVVLKEKKHGKDDLTGGLNEIMNMVQSATGAKLPLLKALGGGLLTDINDQDGKTPPAPETVRREFPSTAKSPA